MSKKKLLLNYIIGFSFTGLAIIACSSGSSSNSNIPTNTLPNGNYVAIYSNVNACPDINNGESFTATVNNGSLCDNTPGAACVVVNLSNNPCVFTTTTDGDNLTYSNCGYESFVFYATIADSKGCSANITITKQ